MRTLHACRACSAYRFPILPNPPCPQNIRDACLRRGKKIGVSGKNENAIGLQDLISGLHVGIVANMKAELIHDFKDVTPEGHLIQMVVWRVPEPIPPSKHYLKYRLVYVVDGNRVVGFDNKRGKGDHCHLDGVERPYTFQTIERLIEDFVAEIEKRRTS